MAEVRCSRRALLSAGAAAGLFEPMYAALLPVLERGSLRLRTLPTRLFKTADAGKEGRESWVTIVIVESPRPVGLDVRSLTVDLLRKGTTVGSRRYAGVGVGALALMKNQPGKTADGSDTYWPLVLWVHCSEPTALGVDAMRVELETAGAGKRSVRTALTLPVEVYTQRTTLIYPFKGNGIVMQAGVTNGGHRNRSGQFAVDGLGLDESWSVSAPGEAANNADYRGWGRELIAPGEGVVARATWDRPDQPVAGKSDPDYYAPGFPDGGDPGNHLVIDHGNAEFSMVAHLQEGSMLVRVGDRVKQGQPVGKLGNSGDTTGPHVHYQLQAGPDWTACDALPCRFSNVEAFPLVRGTFFRAK